MRLNLSKSDERVVLRRLGDGPLEEAGRRAIQQDLKNFREESLQAARKSARKKVAAKRREIEFDPTRFNDMLVETETAMLETGGKYELLVHGGAYARVAEEPPTYMHLIDNRDAKPPSVPLRGV